MNFEEFGVRNEVISALNAMQITEPTEIQQKVIPLIKAGSHVVATSKTGSGKTLAFGIPLVESVHPGKGPQVLVMVPTRELAVQVAGELRKLSKHTRHSITAVYGGVGLEPQIHNMRRADIIVGTPGRLKDHLERNNVDFTPITTIVLDEADKMVEMGFIEDVEIIITQIPNRKQIILLGATLSREVDYLQGKYMPNAVTVSAERHVEEEYLQQCYYCIQPHEKFSLLVHLLKTEQPTRAIIFCSARITVDIVAMNLRRQGFQCEMIHGKLSQNNRLRVIEDFHRGMPPILVASAVAARGLDIKDVTHIFNYDLSQDPQEYVHRVGRTARAGETGKAVTLLSPRDYEAFQNILGRYPVTVEEKQVPSFPRVMFDARRHFDPRGSPGRGRFGHGGFGREESGRGRFGGRESGGGRAGHGGFGRGGPGRGRFERGGFGREGSGRGRFDHGSGYGEAGRGGLGHERSGQGSYSPSGDKGGISGHGSSGQGGFGREGYVGTRSDRGDSSHNSGFGRGGSGYGHQRPSHGGTGHRTRPFHSRGTWK